MIKYLLNSKELHTFEIFLCVAVVQQRVYRSNRVFLKNKYSMPDTFRSAVPSYNCIRNIGKNKGIINGWGLHLPASWGKIKNSLIFFANSGNIRVQWGFRGPSIMSPDAEWSAFLKQPMLKILVWSCLRQSCRAA